MSDDREAVTLLANRCEKLEARLQRAEELRNKWERHANAIPESDCVDSDYRQGFKDALTACVQDYDELRAIVDTDDA